MAARHRGATNVLNDYKTFSFLGVCRHRHTLDSSESAAPLAALLSMVKKRASHDLKVSIF